MKTYIDSSRFRVPACGCHGSRLNSKLKTQNSKLVLISLLFLLLACPPLHADTLTPTPFFMDFYGSIEGAKVEDEITVYSSKGIICGRFIITKEGEYGFLHVYGNDPTTTAATGATSNEPLTFKLNGAPLQTQGPVLWLGDGQRQRVDFKR